MRVACVFIFCALLLCITASSCRKSYTCTCRISGSWLNTNYYDTQVYIYTYDYQKKRSDAQWKCDQNAMGYKFSDHPEYVNCHL